MTNFRMLEGYTERPMPELSEEELESFTSEILQSLRGQNLTNTNASIGLLQIVAAEKSARASRQTAKVAIKVSVLALAISTIGILISAGILASSLGVVGK
ncbi:hypothetical protein [Litorimonas haliclonae]|uniref:hypothetical protein n=1 Tax=Litorimonas haliclonae TaxID=2081977 RepID=UPI0039EEB162